jgi:thiamine-monophosphate kinase
MDFETKIISMINGIMPKSPLRKSISGEVDAEVIQLGDKLYLFTIDDFSQEDQFRENDLYTLGWNIACGAISDIVAAAGKPLVYSHAMVISKDWDEKSVQQFSKGISDVLKIYSISFIGGDLGISDKWRYTASVIGEPVERIVNRKGCRAGDSIFITGKIGVGNFDAAMNLYAENTKLTTFSLGLNNKFQTNEIIPSIISQFATSAIDTSDGVFSALQTLSDINQKGYKIENLPFITKGAHASKLLNLPELLLFLGECGEYEILFTVSKRNKKSLFNVMKEQSLNFYELGKMTENVEEKTVFYKDKWINFADYQLKARDFENVKDYLKNMLDWLQKVGI